MPKPAVQGHPFSLGQIQQQKETFYKMFSSYQLRGSFPTLIFLNQCSGCAPNLDVANIETKDSINEKDGCFECSTISPDTFRLPTFAGDAFKTIEIPASYPQHFYTHSESKPRIEKTPKKTTPTKYQREVLPSKLQKPPPPKKSNSGHQSGHHASWTSPPDGYNFQGENNKFRVVYVEDTKQRLCVEPKHLGMVAIPFLEKVEK
jgi:hypothetical protein